MRKILRELMLIIELLYFLQKNKSLIGCTSGNIWFLLLCKIFGSILL